VVPAAASLQVARSFGRALLASVAVAVAVVVAGLWTAYETDIAAGGAIALGAVAVFFAVVLAKGLARALAPRRAAG
jgi:zinc transport system permease protein